MIEDLIKSAYDNDVAALRRLLAAGADPNQAHPVAGTLPLQLACQANAVDAIRVLLAGGARADITFTRTSRVDGRTFANHTPLMYAESVEAATLLLDAGAKLEQADENEWTALVWAAHAGNPALTRLLMDRGASLSVRPVYEGRRRELLEFMDAAMHPEFEATEAGKARLAALRAVRELLAIRMRA